MAEGGISQFLDSEVVAKLSSQPLLSRFPMEGNISGHHRSPHRGSSVEFAEYRVYTPGDDIRRLDWRVYGRTDRFYLKEFEADTNLRCNLVIDASGSMAFGEGATNKLNYAKKMAATLAYLLIQQGDAVGMTAIAQQVRTIPSKRNPTQLKVLGDVLAEVESNGAGDLTKALHDLAESTRQRAMVVVFSDLFTEPEALLSAFQHIRFKKHDLVVFHLLDRRELEFPFNQPLRFQDMETDHHLICEPNYIRDEYLSHLRRFLTIVQEGCHRLNADYKLVVTDEGFEASLASFLVSRNQLLAGGR